MHDVKKEDAALEKCWYFSCHFSWKPIFEEVYEIVADMRKYGGREWGQHIFVSGIPIPPLKSHFWFLESSSRKKKNRKMNWHLVFHKNKIKYKKYIYLLGLISIIN